MVVLEIVLISIGLAAIISAIDFIAKTSSNITHSLGLPEYLVSTIVISFIVTVPIILTMQLSNFYDAPVLGLSTAIGFATTLMTLVMGIFLLRNELPIEYEGYRNATFMWASAILLLIVSFDRFIDRMDAIFLLLLFAFYVVYIIYRTEKSKEYVYLKMVTFNSILYPVSIIAILVSSWFVVYSAMNLSTGLNVPLDIIGLVIFGFLFALPMFDIIPSIFRSSRLTFDNIIGNAVVCLTLVPASAAIIMPIPFSMGGEMSLMPLILMNIITLFFALSTRFTYTLHKKMGIALIICYILYVLSVFVL